MGQTTHAHNQLFIDFQLAAQTTKTT